MSSFLLIDTSTLRTSIALVSNSKIIFRGHHDGELSHASSLPVLVSAALAECTEIDEVIVGMGPGPFTGLRAGIAFAQSFALARQIPWSGVCSLDAIATQITDHEFIVAVDAKRKEFFYAKYQDGKRIIAPGVCQQLQLATFNLPIHGPSNDEFPDPVKFIEIKESGAIFTEPIYIRRPDAYPPPVGVKFRPLSPLDLIPAYDIEKSAYGRDGWSLAQLKEEYAGKDRMYLAGEFTNELIAYAGVTNLGGVADVLTLTVANAHQRKGIGRELLRRLIDWARTQKCEAIMLEVALENTQAIPLYNSFGFIEISQRKDYYGPGKSARVMRKELQ